MATTRSKSSSEIWNIGAVLEKFPGWGEGLPSGFEVMQYFFYQRSLNNDVRTSAWSTAREVIPFWTDKCRIPVIEDVHVFEKVIKLFNDYSLL